MPEYTNQELESIFLEIIDIDLIREISQPPEKRKLFYIIKDGEFRDYVSNLISEKRQEIKEYHEDIEEKQKKIDDVREKYESMNEISYETKIKIENKINEAQEKINNKLMFPPDLKVQDIVLSAVDMNKTNYVEFKYKINQDYEIFPLDLFVNVPGINKLIKITR